jgi:hypothetical protein
MQKAGLNKQREWLAFVAPDSTPGAAWLVYRNLSPKFQPFCLQQKPAASQPNRAKVSDYAQFRMFPAV